jgi:hypothetical protein
MTTNPEGVDLEALKRLERREYALPPDFVVKFSVSVDALTWDAIIAALERAERDRQKIELLGIEVAGWERLVEDSCGCIPSYPNHLPEDFNERWAALRAAEEGSDG